jgi:hypothetical protein
MKVTIMKVTLMTVSLLQARIMKVITDHLLRGKR